MPAAGMFPARARDDHDILHEHTTVELVTERHVPVHGEEQADGRTEKIIVAEHRGLPARHVLALDTIARIKVKPTLRRRDR